MRFGDRKAKEFLSFLREKGKIISIRGNRVFHWTRQCGVGRNEFCGEKVSLPFGN